MNIEFREDQKPIMNYKGGTLAVPAVPGAGKTFIISNLVSKLIEEQVHKPGKILIVTYMNSAVNNFKQRINKVLNIKGIIGSRDYDVMTIHSLSMKILRDCPHALGINEEFTIIDDITKSIYLGKCIDKWRFNYEGEKIYKSMLSESSLYKYESKKLEYWNGFFSMIETLIGELKIKQISPKSLLDVTNNCEKNDVLRIAAIIYSFYDKEMKKNCYLDYNDILVYALKLLKEDASVREKYQIKYSYVFEDECQDSNLIQGEILKIIAANNHNLIRVGDVNQSITGTFTSSDLKYFNNFCESASQKANMFMSGRSSEMIIDFANRLVEFTKKEHVEDKCREALIDQKILKVPNDFLIQNPPSYNGSIKFKGCTDELHEIRSAAILIQKFKEKYPNKTCAVLVPTNFHVEKYINTFNSINIPCDELSSRSTEVMNVRIKLAYILNYLTNPFDKTKFFDMLENSFFRNKDSINLSIIKRNLINFNMHEIIFTKSTDQYSNIFVESTEYKFLIDIINKLKPNIEYLSNDYASLILDIGEHVCDSQEDQTIIDGISLFVNLKQKEDSTYSLNDFCNSLLDEKKNLIRNVSNLLFELKGYEPSPEKVTVSTYHKAKGLEWDFVILTNLTSYYFPYSLSDKFRDEWYLKEEFKNTIVKGKYKIDLLLNNSFVTKTENELVTESKIEIINEKIRLLYVAITRAKEYLMLTYSVKGKYKDNIPCRYFNVLKNYIEGENSDRY